MGEWLLLSPNRERLYTRSGRRADRASAYDTTDGKQWIFNPPSNNAWPEAATDDAVAVTAINESGSNKPFYSMYAVDADGRAKASLGKETIYDAHGVDGTIYLGDGNSTLIALDP